MRGFRNAAFGRYNFNQIINTDPKRMKLAEIQETIKRDLSGQAANYGIEIVGVGINNINVPKTISEKVFDRMIAERKKESDRIIAEGDKQAETIKIEADRKRAEILAKAEAKALKTRAEADAKAAEYYKVFGENPELAEFLRKLEALRKVMKGRTTLVVDTNTPPFDLLKPRALKNPRTDYGRRGGRPAPKQVSKPAPKPAPKAAPAPAAAK